jgi:phosphoribosylformimino-5-aminoimidazole carboxamide ribonucleotide (ProFAR) isomerase
MHLYGAITGKAMYAGTLDLKEAIQAGKDYAD